VALLLLVRGERLERRSELARNRAVSESARIVVETGHISQSVLVGQGKRPTRLAASRDDLVGDPGDVVQNAVGGYGDVLVSGIGVGLG
jgi:hypothetical protein